MKRALLAASLLFLCGQAHAQDFSYLPAGDLISGSGDGRADNTIYAPGMLFPIDGTAYANSQVYMHGGFLGPGGGQCDVENYSYPWRDNYCETRSWDMPLCPAGEGHQGQDIRPGTCDIDVHWAVAAVDGTITNIGGYSVYLTADDGTRFDYLHMSQVQVSVGQEVLRGDNLGKVSNVFGGTPTTIHLHFNIRQFVDGVGTVYVPPYASLVASYGMAVDGPPIGALESVTCDTVRGWAFDRDDAEAPVDVTLGFDGAGHDVVADVYRGDLCENLSFCEHGFEVHSPLSLFDDAMHPVAASSDGTDLDGSPLTLQCPPPVLVGSKRPISDADYATWRLSAFWDEPPTDDAEVASLPDGSDFSPNVTLWRDSNDALYVYDDVLDVVRPLDEKTARAWRLDLGSAEQQDISAYAIGADWPARPVIVRQQGDAFVVDAEMPQSTSSGASTGSGLPGPEPDPIDDGASSDSGCACDAPGRSDDDRGWWVLAIGGFVGLARSRRSSKRNPSR